MGFNKGVQYGIEIQKCMKKLRPGISRLGIVTLRTFANKSNRNKINPRGVHFFQKFLESNMNFASQIFELRALELRGGYKCCSPLSKRSPLRRGRARNNEMFGEFHLWRIFVEQY